MSRKPLGFAILALVAAGLVALAIKGPKGFLAWFGASSDSAASRSGDELGLDGSTSGMEGAAGRENSGNELDADRAGVLASRHVERRGFGGLTMKIARAGSGVAIEGAPVLVVGTSHAGEEVRANAASDATGGVRFERLAAGQGYVVRIASKPDPEVERPDIEVRAGRDKDLGTIEVGATAALTGRVVDEAGKPVAGAEVRVLTGFENIFELLGNMAELFGTLGREPTPLAKGKSGDDGRFRLEGLPPGPLAIVATASGKRQTVLSIRMTAKGPASGEPTLVLETGSVIAGVVVDSLGAPVVGAQLAMLETGDNDPTSFLTKRTFTTSGAEGRFRALVDDGAREVRAVVNATGFPTTFSAAIKPGREDARIVLVGGATVEVHCEDDAHAPIEGAQVAMGVARGNMNAPDGVGGFLYGSTDATGVVTFASGPGQVEMIIVNHRDFSTVMGSPGREGGEMGPFKLEGDIPKEVAPTGVTKMTIRMKRGIVIRGRVLDSSGNPIAGAEVRTIGAMGFGGGSTNRSAADGTYRVAGAAAAGAEAGGMGGFGGTMVTVKASGWIQKPDSMSVVTANAKDGEVVHDITMLAGAIVRGKVIDSDGSPVVGAEVQIAAGGGFDMASMMGGGGGRKVTTAADGTYEIRDVSPSTPDDSAMSSIREALAPGSPPSEPPQAPKLSSRVSVTAEDRVAAKSEPFLVEAGATVDAPTVKLSAGATLRGKVREPSGRPAVGATVEVSMERDGTPNFEEMVGGAKAKSAKTDSDGAFVVRALGKAKGSVVAKAKGFAPAKAAIEVGDVDPAPIELRLHEVGTLKGRVLTPGGEPIEGATISVSGSAGGSDAAYVESAFASADKEGNFQFEGLPRVVVSLSVAAKGHRGRTVSGSVGGEPVEVRLEPRNPGDERRREEISKELMEIYGKFGSVKDAAERQALAQRMSALQQEQRELESTEGPASEPTPATPPLVEQAPSDPK